MKKTNRVKQRVIAIIGCGPRGLSALESLYAVAAKTNISIKALVFEKSEHLGASWIYDPKQADGNWLNIAERAVAIRPREKVVFVDFQISPFPDFQEWIGFDTDQDSAIVDRFPFRSQMGKYLTERYQSIAKELLLSELLEVIPEEVVKVSRNNQKVSIELTDGTTYNADEAVLAIGHQPTELDDQLTAWQSHVKNNRDAGLFIDTYPIEHILESEKVTACGNIGIRGFGLAMIDVARTVSQGMGGKFRIIDESTREMEYIPSGKESNLLVPFSLDGLPMAPKLLNKKIDLSYVPTETQLEKYKVSVSSAIESGREPESTEFLIEAILPIIAKKFLSERLYTRPHTLKDKEIQELAKSWLLDESFSHPLIVSTKLPAEQMMTLFVGMATGIAKVSLDFCIGHVWRHCQPTMYGLLSFAPLSDELIAEIVALDERLKRYSYGPPVDSLQQILALVKARKLTLNFVKDPKIEMIKKGWRLQNASDSIIVNSMINSVLDAPKLSAVVSPIIKQLLYSDDIEALHDELGIRTDKDGSVEFANSEKDYRLSVLGRLAKGTLIGVDAIAECFGKRSELWARGILTRARQNW